MENTVIRYLNPFSTGSLEDKLFRLGVLCFLITCLLGIIQNLFVETNPLTYYIYLAGVVIFGFIYYRSMTVSIKIVGKAFFLIVAAVLISVGYFLKGGITGSEVLLFPLFIVLGFLFLSAKRYLYFVIGVAILIVALFVVEMLFPQYITGQSTFDVKQRNFFSALFLLSSISGITMYFFRKYYDQERNKSEENQEALEGMNTLLRKVSDEALTATKAKSEFLASMSHEIRTPLHGIIGMTDILKETELSEEQADIVDSVKVSGNILLNIINDILDISKIEAERFELSEAKFDIRKTLNEVLSVVRPKTSEKNVDLTFTISKNVPKNLLGDENRLKQVLLNIAGNAAKFTSKGFVHIELKSKETEEPDLVVLEFNVVDSGIGISEENLKNLFDPFFQEDKVRHNNMGGTGLGLAITQKIVDLMKGKITVKSTEKLGTTFTVVVPFKQDNSEDEVETKPTAASGLDPIRSDLRILVAEDFEINQKVIRMMLEKLGLQADYAVNGREAIEMQRKSSYDLILMDIQMPEMDGIEATRLIRAEGTSKLDPVIIAMSANALNSDQDVAFVVGMNDFISKPATLNKVHEVLKKWESPN